MNGTVIWSCRLFSVVMRRKLVPASCFPEKPKWSHQHKASQIAVKSQLFHVKTGDSLCFICHLVGGKGVRRGRGLGEIRELAWVSGFPKELRQRRFYMGEGGGGRGAKTIMTQTLWGLKEIYPSDFFVFTTECPTILFKPCKQILNPFYVMFVSIPELIYTKYGRHARMDHSRYAREELHYHPYLGSMCEHFL